MSKETHEIVTVGYGACANCGTVGPVRRAKTGRLTQTCNDFKGSGTYCSQNFSRSKAADGAFVARMAKWSKPEFRKAYTGQDEPTGPAPEPAPAPKPKAPAKPAGDMDWLQ